MAFASRSERRVRDSTCPHEAALPLFPQPRSYFGPFSADRLVLEQGVRQHSNLSKAPQRQHISLYVSAKAHLLFTLATWASASGLLAAGGEAKEGWGSLKRQIQQCEPVKWGRQSCVCHWGICTHGVDQDASGQRWGLILQWNLILAARCAPYRDNIASGFIYICEGMHSKSTAILQSKINYVVNLSKLVNNFERRHLSVLGTPPKLQKNKKGCHYTNTIPLLYRQSEESNVKQHLLHHPKWLPISCDVSQLCSIKCSTFPSITIL